MNIKNFTNNGTVNEVHDSVVAISPQGQQIQQNNVGQPQPADPEDPAPSHVHLNTKRSTKLYFFRVIMYSGGYPFSVPVIPVHFLGVKTDYLLRS